MFAHYWQRSENIILIIYILLYFKYITLYYELILFGLLTMLSLSPFLKLEIK